MIVISPFVSAVKSKRTAFRKDGNFPGVNLKLFIILRLVVHINLSDRRTNCDRLSTTHCNYKIQYIE